MTRRLAVLALVAFAVTASLVGALRSSAATRATTGVVVIETSLGYASAEAAGTGMVVSSSGIVLTNNHVIRGATTVKVVVPGSDRSYRATVLGYAIGADVAVLRLSGASGLATVSLGTSSGLRAGQAVSAVGNAGGAGRIVTSTGTITGLGRTITVRDDQGGTARLRGLIRINAELQPGDSGGPLLDSSGRVVGIDTAASTGYAFQSGSNDGYAIPIDRARAILGQIQASRSSASVHVGGTAFLGVLGTASSFSDVNGVVIQQVVSGAPAERAGLERGDMIVRVGGSAVTSTTAISKLLQRKKPGDTIALAWIDAVGNTRRASVKLASGPPQ
jgi:S1-C subfamily serine protease